MNRHIILAMASSLLVVLMVSACAPAAPQPAPTPTVSAPPAATAAPKPAAPPTIAASPTPKKVVKVKYGQTGGDVLDYLPLFVAQEKGYLKDEGIELDIIASAGGSDTAKILTAGDLDVGIMGVEQVARLKMAGEDLRVIAIMTEGVSWALVARKDLGIKTMQDLKGKSVAVSRPGSLTHIMTSYALAKSGMSENDVTIVGTGAGAPQLAALVSKKLDAALLIEPFIAQAEIEGIGDVVYDLAIGAKGYSTTHITAKMSYIAKNRDLVLGLISAFDKALKFLKSDKEGALQVAKKKFPDMQDPVLRKALDHQYITFPSESAYKKAIFDAEKLVLVQSGQLKQEEVPTYEAVAFQKP